MKKLKLMSLFFVICIGVVNLNAQDKEEKNIIDVKIAKVIDNQNLTYIYSAVNTMNKSKKIYTFLGSSNNIGLIISSGESFCFGKPRKCLNHDFRAGEMKMWHLDATPYIVLLKT